MVLGHFLQGMRADDRMGLHQRLLLGAVELPGLSRI